MLKQKYWNLDTNVVSGFADDCEILLQRYALLHSVHFSDFCKIWKDMKMPLVYCGKSVLAELLEFSDEVLHVAKVYALEDERDITFRVGALYLLYGLYFKQPTKGSQKIRMTLNDWKSFKNLQNVLRNAKHYEALYIACKLEVYRAFLHVLTDHDHAPQKSYRKYHTSNNFICGVDKFSITQKLSSFMTNQGLLPALQTLNEKYYQAKCALPGAQGLEPEEALNLVNKDLSRIIKQNYENHLHVQTDPLEITSEPGPSDREKEKSVEDIGTRRKKLREKSFQTKQEKS